MLDESGERAARINELLGESAAADAERRGENDSAMVGNEDQGGEGADDEEA